VIAHNNPLSAKEKARIELYSDDWIALINDRRNVTREALDMSIPHGGIHRPKNRVE
jgi:hypothetical protein